MGGANATAALLGLSRTDVINRALQAYAFLEQAVAEGGRIVVTRQNRQRGGEVPVTDPYALYRYFDVADIDST